MSPDLPPAGDILAAMITPAVLISACGTLSLSTSNRLGRIVDRTRKLAEDAAKLRAADGLPAEEAAEAKELITDQLGRLVKRIRLLQRALTFLYTAIGLLVGSSLTVGLTLAAGGWLSWVPVLFGLAGAGALFYASVTLVREARVAVRSTLIEMAYVRRLVALRTGLPAKDSGFTPAGRG